MARPLRDMAAGRFHVYAHSVWAASALFADDLDRLTFLRELARATAKVGWRCIGYCLMRTHYHLILDVDDGVLPTGMHALNFRYALAFNPRYSMKGHVFGARYDARRLVDDDDLLGAFRYVVMNPVEAMLCDVPQAWPWSTYAGTIGTGRLSTFVDPAPVLGCFDGPPELAAARLRRFVEIS